MKKDEKWRKNTIQVMQAGGDYLDDARASGALGIQARVWQPHRLQYYAQIRVNTQILHFLHFWHLWNPFQLEVVT